MFFWFISKLLVKAQKATKTSELTCEEKSLLKDDLNVSFHYCHVSILEELVYTEGVGRENGRKSG